jgi:DNA-binding transcriptional ArsR family regulator
MKDIVDELAQALTRGDWSAVDTEAELLTEEAVSAITRGSFQTLAESAELVERLYARIRAGQLASEGDEGSKVAKGQLRQLTTMFTIAARYADALHIDVSETSPYWPILEALFGTEELTGKQLAEAVGQTVETVARKLPELREVGLVNSRKAGRATLNRLSVDAKEKVGQRIAARMAAAEAEAVRVSADAGTVGRRAPGATLSGSSTLVEIMNRISEEPGFSAFRGTFSQPEARWSH